MKRLLFIGGQEQALKAAKKLNFEVILFEKESRIDSKYKELVDELYLIEWDNKKEALELAKLLHNKNKIDVVYSFGEQGIKTAAFINSVLGSKGNELYSVNLTSNKNALRDKLKSLNISPVPHSICTNMDDLEKITYEIGFPIIIKPNEGTGSNGVYMFNSKVELTQFLKLEKRNMSLPILIEKYLEGEEISVETITLKNRHTVLGVTQKTTSGAPNFIEIAHKLPAKLELGVVNEIEKLAYSVLDAIEYKEGLAHIEMKITDKGPRIIEAHVRPGGDKITDLINITYEIDVFYEILNYFKRSKGISKNATLKKHSSIRYILLPEGKVNKFEGLDLLNNNPNVRDFKFFFKKGDTVNSSINSKTRHGYFLVEADTEHELNKVINQLKKEVIIEINKVRIPVY